MKYDEVDFLPSTVDANRAKKNVALYLTLISRLIAQRNFMKLLKTNMEEYEPYLSGHAFPDLLSIGTGSFTLHEFLNAITNDVKVITENLELALLPLVDIFTEQQLKEAYDRLNNLISTLQEDVIDY